MKKNFLFSIAALGAALLTFSGCSDDVNYNLQDGEGRVLLRAVLNNDVSGTVTQSGSSKVRARAGVANDELAAKTLIWISNDKGVVRKFDGIGQIPAEGIWLMADNYVAEAWAGDSVSASFEDKYFKAREPFAIGGGQTLQIDLELKIANVVVEVDYDEALQELIENPEVVAGHRRGNLTYTGFEMASTPGYFMMPSTDPNIAYTFTATATSNGAPVKMQGTIENARPGYKYILHVIHNAPENDPIGGGIFTIVVDEEEIVVEDRILIESAPVISGIKFDIANPVVGEEGKLEAKKLWIQSVAALKSVEISCPTGFDELGIGGNDFEIFGMQPQIADQLAAKGFSYTLVKHLGEEVNPEFEEMKIVFGDEFMNTLPNGEHDITITATDAGGRVGTATMRVLITDAAVQTEEMTADQSEAWATKVTLTGTVLKEGVENLGFNYREEGTQQWNFVAYDSSASGARRRAARRVPAVGEKFSVVIEGLTPGTTYEYQAVCDTFEALISKFTTETEAQMPNSDFEQWASFKSGKDTKNVLHIAPNAEEMFWDSGNHGSATMNKEVTEQASDKVHSGQYSAKLCSQFVGVFTIGKFAAGNLFVGRYLDTDGTDGVLGWGRPFSSRPKSLNGWVHYTPGNVEYTHSAVPDIVKGQPDKGIVYIAIVDDTKTTYGGEQWPCVVKTKTAELFDPEGPNVIGYGKLEFTEATQGTEMVEFNIPIVYRRTNAKAKNIIVVASASKGGDYFAGGTSTMYIDDLKLVY